jgi:hypothetical protein
LEVVILVYVLINSMLHHMGMILLHVIPLAQETPSAHVVAKAHRSLSKFTRMRTMLLSLRRMQSGSAGLFLSQTGLPMPLVRA